MFTRRNFLRIVPAGAVLALGGWGLPQLLRKKSQVSGKIAGANATIGHLMRFGKFPSPSSELAAATVIVGGGVSGLSAGWWLEKNSHKDFLLLELDENVGGNSQSGQNGVSSYPWGAHYLPLPSSESVYVKTLLRELNVITGEDNGLPVYNDFYLCSDPHERVYFQGRWHDGLLPQQGVSEENKKQYAEFFAFMKEQGARKGKDGKTAFAIPLEESSHDPEIQKLDTLTMAQFMDEKGWHSKTLRWYANYCTRDDYGLTLENVSAWAGIHYFASRSGKAANAGKETVLTWPEGNGWLVKRLEEKLSSHIRKNALVYNIEKSGDGYFVDHYLVIEKRSVRIKTKNVIYAAPRYTAKYSLNKNIGEFPLPEAQFAPWMVANITLKRLPEGKGQDISWDNVSYYSPSLGYIVATHQNLARSTGKSVITYYLPLTDEAPDAARRSAFTKDHAHWAELVRTDLEKMHPGITEDILSLDVWVWGHGMVGPSVGYIWGENRKKMKESIGRIHFAHTEMSGISIFEEAQYRGVMAAKKVLG